jgi:hypothetical protein
MWYDPILKNFDHRIKKDEIALKVCPFCGNDRYNCEISMTKKLYHCWACGAKGTGEWFLKMNGLPSTQTEWATSLSRGIIEPKVAQGISLDAFPVITCSRYEDFKTFLNSKGIDSEDVARYGFRCQDKMVVVPLYEGSKLVYYIRRDTVSGRYFNPTIPKGGLLPYYVGSLGCDVVFLVEGTFDAISINKLGYTAAVLLGTHMTMDQTHKLRAFGFKKVVVCLDGDVYSKALELQQTLQCDGFDSYLVKFHGKEDPNDVFTRSPQELAKLLQNFKKPTLLDKVLARI